MQRSRMMLVEFIVSVLPIREVQELLERRAQARHGNKQDLVDLNFRPPPEHWGPREPRRESHHDEPQARLQQISHDTQNLPPYIVRHRQPHCPPSPPRFRKQQMLQVALFVLADLHGVRGTSAPGATLSISAVYILQHDDIDHHPLPRPLSPRGPSAEASRASSQRVVRHLRAQRVEDCRSGAGESTTDRQFVASTPSDPFIGLPSWQVQGRSLVYVPLGSCSRPHPVLAARHVLVGPSSMAYARR
ncbi:hypothetical protein BD626DRAFT_213705 [Schizophyllum amplum]|uniref:Uncharacterized protein n=1 Tax=Schizophyllum amplum TaxID=97359 RepID=A0A550BXP1_9AGAR|nr:hypothetical protein BD626DRAFT_213705 [Auriculariopsis ampla]